MTVARKTLAAFGAALPFLAIFCVALFMALRIVPHAGPQFSHSLPDLVTLMLHDSPFSTDETMGLGISILVIAVLQVGLAAVFITDLNRHVQLSTVARVSWSVALVFVGSFALPAYWLVHMALGKGRRDAAVQPPAAGAVGDGVRAVPARPS